MATPGMSEGPELPPEMQAVPLRVLEVSLTPVAAILVTFGRTWLQLYLDACVARLSLTAGLHWGAEASLQALKVAARPPRLLQSCQGSLIRGTAVFAARLDLRGTSSSCSAGASIVSATSHWRSLACQPRALGAPGQCAAGRLRSVSSADPRGHLPKDVRSVARKGLVVVCKAIRSHATRI